uniref:Uncharacterized protein n=1 Tax=Nymphaea colorata TaxID=210225 RepID=A0A5K0Y6K6_9MAGN
MDPPAQFEFYVQFFAYFLCILLKLLLFLCPSIYRETGSGVAGDGGSNRCSCANSHFYCNQFVERDERLHLECQRQSEIAPKDPEKSSKRPSKMLIESFFSKECDKELEFELKDVLYDAEDINEGYQRKIEASKRDQVRKRF